MRQATEHHLDAAPVDAVIGHEIGQPGARKVREDRGDGLSRMGIGGEGDEVDAGVVDTQPQQVGAGIAGRSEQGGSDGRGHLALRWRVL